MEKNQDPRFDMNTNRDDLQKEFEQAAKDRIQELKDQSKSQVDSLKDETEDLKKIADDSYDDLKDEMNDWDDPYKDEKINIEGESTKVVKKEIDADYEDSIDQINSETDHRVDSIERLMDDDMNKDYDKGVDAIYLNQSEDKFQHQKDHYKDRSAEDYDTIKASYDDINEANASDRIEDYTTKSKGCGCSSSDKTYGASDGIKADSKNNNYNANASSQSMNDFEKRYGKTCASSDNGIKANSADQLKASSTNSMSDNQKNYTNNYSNDISNSSSAQRMDDSVQSALDNGYTITEEYTIIISEDDSDDMMEEGSNSNNIRSNADTNNENISGKSCKDAAGYSEGETDIEGNRHYHHPHCAADNQSNYSGNAQSAYTSDKQSGYSNNIQNESSNKVKGNACDSNLKQDILDEASRVMGDDV